MHPAKLDLSGCEWGDVDCIGQKYDEQRFSSDFLDICIPWKPMEGYEPPSYFELKEKGLIKIKTIDPFSTALLWIMNAPIGACMAYFGKTGDISRVEIYYPMGAPNSMIGHEISHMYCRDRGLFGYLMAANYTFEQREIMKLEGVDKWTDTNYYNLEDATYHFIYKGETDE